MEVRRWALVGIVATIVLVFAACSRPSEDPGDHAAPEFDSAFWDTWGDGKAELAGYRLIYPRYGELRQGTAVSIFVTETFSNSSRVKHEGADRPESDRFPVMKLNLVQDFPTGIYDYNLMTSAFVSLDAVNGHPPGTPTKISFSSQEWCGQTFAQALFDERDIRYTSHSYFDGEADEAGTLDLPAAAIAEDALLLWARGFSGPVLEPGEHREVRLLRSFERVRLEHTELAWDHARLSRGADPESITVAAGTFEVERYSAEVTGPAGNRTWTFLVERTSPRRIVRWGHDGGLEATLQGSKRLEYWSMNGTTHADTLEQIGL